MSQLPQPPDPLDQRTREPREADLRYRAFFDNTSEGIYRIDFTSPIPITLPDDELIDQLRRHAVLGEVNEAMSKMYGLTPGEIVGQPATTFAPDYGTRQLMAIRAPGHRVSDVATVDVDKDGQSVHLLETFTCIVEYGHVVHIWGLQRDITARWRAERAMEKRLETLTQPLTDDGSITFEDLFNLVDIQRLQDEFARATGVASIITGPDGTPITAPSGFCRLCKDIIREAPEGRANCYRSDALLGRARPEGPVVQPCTSGGLWDAGAGISVGGRHLANWLIGQVRDETQTEDRMRAYAREIGANEHEVIAAFREVPGMSREQFGHVAQVLFTLANQLSTAAYQNIQQARFITECRRAEQEQRQLQGQLAQAQKMESIGRLAGGVAHDFNNMLAVILGHTELALDRLVSIDPLHADLMEIRKAAERSAGLVRQLLAFARKQTVSPRVLDLNAVVDGMLKMLRRLIGEDVNLAWRPGTDLRPVKIDPSQLDQVLTNLCVNARDSIDGVGTITIETRNGDIDEAFCATHPGAVPGGYVTLDVADTGCGMSRDVLEHLFEPFYTTKGAGRGTGLGLATVYGIVKQNDGFVDVLSEEGQGTIFRIYVPAQADAAAAMPANGLSGEPERGHETVLLVEDEAAILSLGKIMLEKMGYTVLTAGTPAEAIESARTFTGDIHLLITDVVMPEMNGRDLATRLLSFYPNIGRLFMSGYTANVIAHHGVLEDGVRFIQKPFSARALAAKVREALDQG